MTGRKVGNQDYLEKPRRCKGWVALRLVGSDAVEQGRNLGSATFSSGDLSEAPSAVNIRDGGWHLTSPAEAVNAAGAAIGEAPAAAPTCRVSGAGTLCQRSNNWNSSSGLEAQGSESRVLVSRPMTPAGLAATSPPPPPPGASSSLCPLPRGGGPADEMEAWGEVSPPAQPLDHAWIGGLCPQDWPLAGCSGHSPPRQHRGRTPPLLTVAQP